LTKEGRKNVIRHKTASTNDGLPEISKMKYRIPDPGTTISGFADSKKKKINANRPTLDFLDTNLHQFFFFILVHRNNSTLHLYRPSYSISAIKIEIVPF
jgi:hypothetical protein